MNRILIGVVGAIATFSAATSAYAATFTPGDPNFQVTGDPFSGTVSAFIGNSGIAAGAFSDTFQFTLGQTGLGSGSLSTSTSIFGDLTDLDLTSVTVNGMAATRNATPQNLVETYYLYGVPITAGVLNTITVVGLSRGNGSYGGNVTFVPFASGAPEPASWAMMILGFGLAGTAMRYRRRSTRLAFAA